MKTHYSLLLLLPLLLLAAALAWAQDEPEDDPPPKKPAPEVVVWEYKLMTWTREDTTAAMRTVSGDSLARPRDVIRKLADQVEPRNHPRIQVAVDRRLNEKLAKAGLKGWEAFWVRDTTLIIEGFVLPAPSVMLKRRKRS